MEQIPIIDLNFIKDYSKDSEEQWVSLGYEIRNVMGRIGFIQLINHGIPEDVVNSVFELNQKFFELPNATKIKFTKPNSMEMTSYYGYTKFGEETFGKEFGNRESFDWIEGHGVYPDEELPNFSVAIKLFHEHCKSVTKKLLRLFALGLGLEDVDFFVKRNKHWDDPDFTGMSNIRLAYYPKIQEANIPAGAVRIGEHTDFITVTLLFQDEAGGLEARNLNGDWIPVTPIKGGIVVNTGDLLEYWTSGIFQATPHRVVIPESELLKAMPRYSVVFFDGPEINATVTPLKISKTEEEEERIAKLGKTYPSDPVNAREHVFRKVKAAYAK